MVYEAANEIVRPLAEALMSEHDFEADWRVWDYTDEDGMKWIKIEVLVDEDIAITPEQVKSVFDRIRTALRTDDRTWDHAPLTYFNVRETAEIEQ